MGKNTEVEGGERVLGKSIRIYTCCCCCCCCCCFSCCCFRYVRDEKDEGKNFSNGEKGSSSLSLAQGVVFPLLLLHLIPPYYQDLVDMRRMPF